MSEVYTQDIMLCAAMLYVYGEECLRKIEMDERRRAGFTVGIPSFDFQGFEREYHSEDGLAISNLKAFVRIHGNLSRRLRDMNRIGEASWTAWDCGQF